MRDKDSNGGLEGEVKEENEAMEGETDEGMGWR